MAVVFDSQESQVNFEVGEYEEFPQSDQEGTASKRPFEVGEYQQFPISEKETSKDQSPDPRLKYFRWMVLAFCLICVLQVILNISLRLTLNQDKHKGEEEESCPPDWIMFNSSCYYFSKQRKNWDDSRQECKRRDADLAIIGSREEQDLILKVTVAAWVGMTDRAMEGKWIWVDGTPVDMDRLLWAPGQPDGAFSGEDCGDIRNMNQFVGLNDLNCGVRNQWICEKAPRVISEEIPK